MKAWRLAGLSKWLRGRPSWVRLWLAGHHARQDETVFTNRLRQSAALLMLFRALGTGAAALALLSVRQKMVSHSALLSLALVFYLGYSLLIGARLVSWPARQDGSASPMLFHPDTQLLMGKTFFIVDASVAVALNLTLAVALARGQVYGQYTDLFLVATTTFSTLITGRWGPLAGLASIPAFALIEIVKAPLNGTPLAHVSWGIVATRGLWALAGVLIGVGMRHIFASFSLMAERLSVAASILQSDQRARDRYVKALLEARSVLEEPELTPAARLAHAKLILAGAGNEVEQERVQGSPETIRHIADRVKVAVSWELPYVLLEVVFGGGRLDARSADPESLDSLLHDLAAQAGAGRCTIRWRAVGRNPTHATITVMGARELQSDAEPPQSALAFITSGGRLTLTGGRKLLWRAEAPLVPREPARTFQDQAAVRSTHAGDIGTALLDDARHDNAPLLEEPAHADEGAPS